MILSIFLAKNAITILTWYIFQLFLIVIVKNIEKAKK